MDAKKLEAVRTFYMTHAHPQQAPILTAWEVKLKEAIEIIDELLTERDEEQLARLLLQIADDYRTSNDPYVVQFWAARKADGSGKFLAAFVDDTNKQIDGSVPWDWQSSVKDTIAKMQQIYQAYKERKANG